MNISTENLKEFCPNCSNKLILSKDVKSCLKGHPLCTECIIFLVEDNINNKIFQFKCLYHGCDSIYPSNIYCVQIDRYTKNFIIDLTPMLNKKYNFNRIIDVGLKDLGYIYGNGVFDHLQITNYNYVILAWNNTKLFKTIHITSGIISSKNDKAHASSCIYDSNFVNSKKIHKSNECKNQYNRSYACGEKKESIIFKYVSKRTEYFDPMQISNNNNNHEIFLLLLDYLLYNYGNRKSINDVNLAIKESSRIYNLKNNSQTGLKYISSFSNLNNETFNNFTLPIWSPIYNFCDILDLNIFNRLKSFDNEKLENNYISSAHLLYYLNYFLTFAILEELKLSINKLENFNIIDELEIYSAQNLVLRKNLIFRDTSLDSLIFDYILLEDLLKLFFMLLRQRQLTPIFQNETFTNLLNDINSNLLSLLTEYQDENIRAGLYRKMIFLQMAVLNRDDQDNFFILFSSLKFDDIISLCKFLKQDMCDKICQHLENKKIDKYQRVILIELLKNLYLKNKFLAHYIHYKNSDSYIDSNYEYRDLINQEKKKLYWYQIDESFYAKNESEFLLNTYLTIGNMIMFECQCCYTEGVFWSEGAICPERHIFCKTCLNKYIEVELGEGRYNFKCMESGCLATFGLPTIEATVNEDLFARFINLMLSSELAMAEIANFVSCPFCFYGVIIEDQTVSQLTCLNPNCRKITCRMCKELDHAPNNCKLKISPATIRRNNINNYISDAIVRTCYQCKMRFYKEIGCNMIHCRCGATICYICRKKIDSYNHFKDNGCTTDLSSDQLHKREIEIATADAIKIYGKDILTDKNAITRLPNVPNIYQYRNLIRERQPPIRRNKRCTIL